MKHFIVINWYRLITASAMLIFAIAFFVFVLQNNPAKAGIPASKETEQQNSWIVANEKGIFEVTWNKNRYPNYECNIIFNGNGK